MRKLWIILIAVIGFTLAVAGTILLGLELDIGFNLRPLGVFLLVLSGLSFFSIISFLVVFFENKDKHHLNSIEIHKSQDQPKN